MGIWNSHTSVGNILGSLIAGVWVSDHWGLSFVVPGVITAVMGIITFLFLIECKRTLPPHRGRNSGRRRLPTMGRLLVTELEAGV